MAELLDYALTTVSDVKETLGISSGDTSKDNLIKRKINQATEMIENYTGRRFKLTQYTNEEYDATGTDQIILRQRPVVVDNDHSFSLGNRDTALNEDDWSTVDSNLQFLDSSAGVLDLEFSTIGKWNRYRISYYAGYSTIPSDISEAAATLAGYLVENGTSGTNIKSKKEGLREVSYFDPKASSSSSSSVFDLLNIAGILDSYSNNPILADK